VTCVRAHTPRAPASETVLQDREVAVRAGLAIGAVMALAVIGCGGDGDADGGDGATVFDSPLGDYLGGSDYDEDAARAEQLAVEQAVAECMVAEGWEYQPVDQSQFSGDDFPQPEVNPADDPVAYGERYGYGVVWNYEVFTLPRLQGGEDPFQFEDPNQDYVASLEQSEIDAYYASLYGDQTGFAEGEEYVPPPLEEQGCQGKARKEVVGERPYDNPDIQQRINEYYENANSDPRIEAANDVWVECMVEDLGSTELTGGLRLTGPQDIDNYLSILVAEAMGQEVLPVDPDTGEPIGEYDESLGYSAIGNADGSGFAFIGPEAEIAPDDLAALREREIELWKLDYGCQQDAEINDVRIEVERDLVAELEAEFPLGEG
jgi:hypothetical protein